MARKTIDWSNTIRKSCIKAQQSLHDQQTRRVEKRNEIQGETLYSKEIQNYLAKGGTVKVQPTIHSLVTDPYNDWNKETDYTAQRDRKEKTFCIAATVPMESQMPYG